MSEQVSVKPLRLLLGPEEEVRVGVLSRFERRLGGLVEGAFAKVFKGGVEPVELAGALREEMDSRRVISATRTLVPNDFLIELSGRDHEHLVPYEQALATELAEIVKDFAADQRYTFVGNVRVRFARNDSLDTGIFTVSSGVIGPGPGVPGRPAWPPPMGQHGGQVGPAPEAPAPRGGPGAIPAGQGMPPAGPVMPPAGPGVPPTGQGTGPAGSVLPAGAGVAPAGPEVPPLPARQPGWGYQAWEGGDAHRPGREGASPGAPDAGAGPARPAPADWNAIPGRPRLVVAAGSGDGGRAGPGHEYVLDGDHVLLGRTADSTIRLSDTRVSRRHGEITRLAGAARGVDVYIYRDLDSTNGSLVNGQRVSRAQLHDGDQIELGSTRLVFRVDPVGYPGYPPGRR